MKERSPPGLVVVYSVGTALWELVFGGRADTSKPPLPQRASSIPHSFSKVELDKFECNSDGSADLDCLGLAADGNFEELLGNSLAICWDVLRANWFLTTKMSLETLTVLVTIWMQQYIILGILTALVVLLCIEDFLIVQETNHHCPETPQNEVGATGKHAETPTNDKESDDVATVDQRLSGS